MQKTPMMFWVASPAALAIAAPVIPSIGIKMVDRTKSMTTAIARLKLKRFS